MVNLNNKTINMKVIVVNPKYQGLYEKNVDELNLQDLLGTNIVTKTVLPDKSIIITPKSFHKDTSGFIYEPFKSHIVFNRALILNSTVQNIHLNHLKWLNDETLKEKELSRMTVENEYGRRVWKV